MYELYFYSFNFVSVLTWFKNFLNTMARTFITIALHIRKLINTREIGQINTETHSLKNS